MDPNSAATTSTNLLKSSVNLPLTNLATSPAPPPPSAAGNTTCSVLNSLNSPLMDNLTPTTQSSLDSASNHALKGVYTLAEEPELEAQETQIDRI
ncbi:hypothetical protein DOY81_005593 [Sarcophaga bullata]|nr:hypothetical protein DOY81_005593 [Sarcophaga bullata]